ERGDVGRVMALGPEIVFFDEPAAGVDPVVAAGIDQLILHLKEALGVTLIVVTHELASAFLIADRILVLDAGNILNIAPPEELKQSTHPRIRQFLNRVPDSDAVEDVDNLQLFTDS